MASLKYEKLNRGQGRILFIGDVHGCSEELEKLILEFNPSSKDLMIAVGDLINKGPNSPAVLDLIRKHSIHCIHGNHERKLLKYLRTGHRSDAKPGDLETISAISSANWDWIESWPQAYAITGTSLIAVHGGFMPKKKWRKQEPDLVTTIQVINKKGKPSKRSRDPDGKPWADFWKGPETVVYGHTPRPHIFIHPNAIGLDTGCVYGGILTGWVYPQNEFIQIPARMDYTA